MNFYRCRCYFCVRLHRLYTGTFCNIDEILFLYRYFVCIIYFRLSLDCILRLYLWVVEPISIGYEDPVLEVVLL